jgi:hypothetical protein
LKLSAPKPATFWVAVVVVLIGVLARLVASAAVPSIASWGIVVLGFIILAAGNLVEGL